MGNVQAPESTTRDDMHVAVAIGWLIMEGYEVEKHANGYAIVTDPEGVAVDLRFKDDLIFSYASRKGCPWLQTEAGI